MADVIVDALYHVVLSVCFRQRGESQDAIYDREINVGSREIGSIYTHLYCRSRVWEGHLGNLLTEEGDKFCIHGS